MVKTMRAVLCGYYGMGNGGDEALLASLLQMLPPDVTPIVLSGDPQQTYNRYGVESRPRKSLPQVQSALNIADAFIWGGGSLMQDATSALSPVYYAGLMGLARRVELTTIAWAQGIGPLNRQFTTLLARKSFAACQGISVRDGRSGRILQEWKLPFIMAPDPVWALDASPVPGLGNLPAPRVAVTLRSHPQLTRSRLDNLTRALADFQVATDTFILLLPFQPSRDLEMAEWVRSRLSGDSTILQLEDPRQLKGAFAGVEMAIGMRFHSLVMAAAEGCRCFALSYDPKVTQLMAELDLPGWELDALPDNANAISKAWIECYANGEALSRDRLHSLRDRALMHQELLHEIFSV